MRALIYEAPDAPGAGALEIAGQPLLVRQLQWLRGIGIEDVFVEVAAGQRDDRAALLLGADPLVSRCVALPTPYPLGVEALADRAGLDEEELFLALPADVLVHASFTLPDSGRSYPLRPPPFAPEASPITLAFRTRAGEVESESEPHPGWALRIAAESDAHALTSAVLAQQGEGVLMHAAEVRPSIWLARGARVSEDATLVPPILLGPDARVFAKARVGPNVIVGRAAVIERDAVLSDVSIAAETLVGEGARIRQAHVEPTGFTSFVDGTRTEVDDPLLLASARIRPASLGPRSAGLALLTLLGLLWVIPALARALLGKSSVKTLRFQRTTLHVGKLGIPLLDLVPALYDVVYGTRDLVGVADPALLASAASDTPLRVGAIDISRALAPAATPSTLRAMWRWYLKNKCRSLDRALLFGGSRAPSRSAR